MYTKPMSLIMGQEECRLPDGMSEEHIEAWTVYLRSKYTKDMMIRRFIRVSIELAKERGEID